jgi:NADP-dependent 3-hydroxy acid dehydrogenase YdfG
MASKTPVWFIVGASSGFGQAIARVALARNHKVVAAARRLHAMADLEEAGATLVQLDVTASSDELAPKVQQAVDAYGYITHVINGVGYPLGGVNEGMT